MDSGWQFEPLLAERLDKARQLLVEDEAYRGDSGLKVLGVLGAGGAGGCHPVAACRRLKALRLRPHAFTPSPESCSATWRAWTPQRLCTALS